MDKLNQLRAAYKAICTVQPDKAAEDPNLSLAVDVLLGQICSLKTNIEQAKEKARSKWATGIFANKVV